MSDCFGRPYPEVVLLATLREIHESLNDIRDDLEFVIERMELIRHEVAVGKVGQGDDSLP